jgi:hypothetical protein
MNTTQTGNAQSLKAIEDEFSLAFGLLRRCPQVSEIDFGTEALPENIELDELDQIARRYGLLLTVYESGRITVKCRAKSNGKQADKNVKSGLVGWSIHLPNLVSNAFTRCSTSVSMKLSSLKSGLSGSHEHIR